MKRWQSCTLSGLTLMLALASAWLMSTGARAEQRGQAYTLQGEGTPAAVLQAGLGDGQSVWQQVLPALAAHRAVVAIDRPGHGRAPAGDGPRDPCRVAVQQRALLREAGVAPPFLLVGHSLGGLYQFVYAHLYPQDVAGLVLLDPTHPRHWAVMQAEAPTQAALVKALLTVTMSRVDREEFRAQADCLDRLALERPPALPVLLQFSGRPGTGEDADFRRLLEGLRRDWLRLAGAAPDQARTVWDSGHYIQKERPDAVAAAVQAVAAQAGGSTAGMPASSTSPMAPGMP